MVHKIVEPKTSQCRIIKTCMANPGWDSWRLTMEAKILQNLDHPHILRVFSWCEYDNVNYVSICMDNCAGGELPKAVRAMRQANQAAQSMGNVGGISQSWVATAIRQCLGALAYVHSKGLVHKDIKGANLLLQYAVSPDSKMLGTLPHIVI